MRNWLYKKKILQEKLSSNNNFILEEYLDDKISQWLDVMIRFNQINFNNDDIDDILNLIEDKGL